MKKNDRGYKIQTSLEFKTNKEKKGKRKLTFGLFIIIGIVMLASVCTLLLLKEYDFDIDNIIGRSPETTQTTDETEYIAPVEGKAAFLLAVSDDDGKKLHYAAIAGADAESGKINIYTLDVKKTFSTENVKGSLSSVFTKSDGSMLKLKEAVSEVTGVDISRYIRATDTSFKTIVKVFGGISYNIPDKVSYSCDGVGYIIEKGTQTLTADMSYKYMYYLSQQHVNKPDEMSSFLSAFLNSTITAQNDEKSEYYYNRLRNILDTDISAFDFSNSRAAVSQFIVLFDGKEANVVESPEDLFN